ncbi:C5a anaphylatoxin chemotactic receptor 1 [Nelusetta ayraudi]|uniref:C5a anaphylatoxin chemotactic receptor 1 n=1 Tax=Nelusetta ayraudi TaxID=303726 RepID=UPI003F71E809
MDYMDYENLDLYSLNESYLNYSIPDIPDISAPEIQPLQIATLVFYGLVVLLGVPGNAVVVWVTGFCMQRSVTSLWFLNLALADLLCCLSLPLLMVPLAYDDHWHFGPLACTMVKSLFYLVMLCSVLQLAIISVDRWLMVSRPVWCQNNRRPRQGALGCVLVWCLALLGSIPQFIYTKEIQAGDSKRECVAVHTWLSAWLITVYRFLVGFLLPFLVIVVCHWVVYRKAAAGGGQLTRSRSNKTRRVIGAVILSFFLCWLPLHVTDFLYLVIPPLSQHRPKLYLANALALSLAYFNSCLNPLLYVCLGRGFKDSMSRSLRSMLHFISEEPAARVSITNNDTKSTSNGKEMTKI